MSDLQCAARLLLGSVRDAADAEALVCLLGAQRLAAVFCSPAAAGVAGTVVDGLGLGPAVQREGLDHPDGAGSVTDAVDRARAVLDDIVDAFRGEAVLVLGSRDLWSAVLPGLQRGAGFRADLEGDTGLVHVDADSDGWVVRRSQQVGDA